MSRSIKTTPVFYRSWNPKTAAVIDSVEQLKDAEIPVPSRYFKTVPSSWSLDIVPVDYRTKKKGHRNRDTIRRIDLETECSC